MEHELDQIDQQLVELRHRRREILRQKFGGPVDDFELFDLNGNPIHLADLFGQERELIVVHNMGKDCSYCTLWAHGLQGLYRYIASRCAFALITPDSPEIAAAFVQSQGWTFPVFCDTLKELSQAFGFYLDGSVWPGFSTLSLSDSGEITRVSADFFGPGDDYCALWHMFDHLPQGQNDWSPTTT